MVEYGDFNISENELELYLLLDNDILVLLDFLFMVFVSVEEIKEVEVVFEILDMEGFFRFGVFVFFFLKRFKFMIEE